MNALLICNHHTSCEVKEEANVLSEMFILRMSLVEISHSDMLLHVHV